MAQIIDIDERRKPRPAAGGQSQPRRAAGAGSRRRYVEQLVAAGGRVWRSWIATWGSLWLAPLGLQVSPVELPVRRAAQGPRRARAR